MSGAREPLSVSELCVCEYTCSVSASNERSDETERTTGVGTKSPMFEQINKGLPDVYQLDGLISKFSIYLFISFHFQLKLMWANSGYLDQTPRLILICTVASVPQLGRWVYTPVYK